MSFLGQLCNRKTLLAAIVKSSFSACWLFAFTNKMLSISHYCHMIAVNVKMLTLSHKVTRNHNLGNFALSFTALPAHTSTVIKAPYVPKKSLKCVDTENERHELIEENGLVDGDDDAARLLVQTLARPAACDA